MADWHHQLNRHEFEQTPGDSEGQGSPVCRSPWGRKESDTTEQLSPAHSRVNQLHYFDEVKTKKHLALS